MPLSHPLLPRITCPVCGYTFSALERPQTKPRLLYAETTCPNCKSTLRPDKRTRILTTAAAVIVIPFAVLFFLSSDRAFGRIIAVVGMVATLGLAAMASSRVRWEVVTRGTVPTAAATTAAGERKVFAGTFTRPGLNRIARFSGIALSALAVALFVFLARTAPLYEASLVFYVCATASGVIALVLLLRPRRLLTIQIDQNGIVAQSGQQTTRITWPEVRRVVESPMWRKITISSGRGQTIALPYAIEDFGELRSLLLLGLAEFYAARRSRTVFSHGPMLAVLFTGTMLLIVALIVPFVMAERYDFFVALLVVLPVALMFLLFGFRHVRQIALTPTGIVLKRLLWTTRVIPYEEIREIRIAENLEPIVGLSSPQKNGSPGLIITDRKGATAALLRLQNGPMELYAALLRELRARKLATVS